MLFRYWYTSLQSFNRSFPEAEAAQKRSGTPLLCPLVNVDVIHQTTSLNNIAIQSLEPLYDCPPRLIEWTRCRIVPRGRWGGFMYHLAPSRCDVTHTDTADCDTADFNHTRNKSQQYSYYQQQRIEEDCLS